jgi:hypothetical protein
MTKKKIDIRDYAGEIIKAMRPGILLTTKVGGKVNSMTIGWGTLSIIWGLQFFNRGISGNTLEDLKSRWQQDVLDLKPDPLL